ncbi:MAG: flagellar hook-associated protein FlgK [Tepidisphaera sp.]
MSLNSALNIGRSALTASQIGIQVAGNNLANASTPGYSRQTAYFSPASSQFIGNGVAIGRGVVTDSVRRQVDNALQARLFNTLSTESAALQRSSVYSGVESAIGELSDNDISSGLSSFFNTWSERANLTKSSASVVQEGDRLAALLRRQRTSLTQLRDQIDGQIGAAVVQADALMSTIAQLNVQVSTAEGTGAEASTLRDQRDRAISELAQLMDVSVVDNGAQGLTVLVGSEPIVVAGTSRGLSLSRENDANGDVQAIIRTKDRPTAIIPREGQLGAMLSGRTEAVDDATNAIDTLASQLIFQVNKLHSTGTNATGLSTTTGTLQVASGDRTRALNDPANTSFSRLPFAASNGGFSITVKQPNSSQSTTVRIDVDLDGLTAAGLPGTSDDTSLEDIRAALGAVSGITATITSEGKLKIDADAGVEFSFSEDSSSVLAVLGVNAYFTGTDASTIGVREDLLTSPDSLAVGRMVDGTFVENATALGLADLLESSLTDLSGRSITSFWREKVAAIGTKSAGAAMDASAAGDVRASLENQRAAVSGVSTDEESLNLMAFQRQYQGAARLISVADEMFDTLMSLV